MGSSLLQDLVSVVISNSSKRGMEQHVLVASAVPQPRKEYPGGSIMEVNGHFMAPGHQKSNHNFCMLR